MRRFFYHMGVVAAVLAGVYLFTPIYAAIELKRAIRTGDVDTVRNRVAWDKVRTSLRATLAEVAPDETRRRLSGIPIINRWAERLAAHYAPAMVDRMVESYATPAGLVQLAGWRDTIRGVTPPRDFVTVGTEMWHRLRRLSFASITRVEMIVADRTDATKQFFGAMELIDGSWKLTEVRFLRDAGTTVAPLLSAAPLLGAAPWYFGRQ